jgi:sulfur relay (sulfurtransferase) DsrC/TusE family protein
MTKATESSVEITKIIITNNLMVTDWFPISVRPVYVGFYQLYWLNRRYPQIKSLSPNNAAIPSVGDTIGLDFWDGRAWWLKSADQRAIWKSSFGPGKNEVYWRGIKFNETIHGRGSSLGDDLFSCLSFWNLTNDGWLPDESYFDIHGVPHCEVDYVAQYCFQISNSPSFARVAKLVRYKQGAEKNHKKLLKLFGPCPLQHHTYRR